MLSESLEPESIERLETSLAENKKFSKQCMPVLAPQELELLEAELGAAVGGGRADAFVTYLYGLVLSDRRVPAWLSTVPPCCELLSGACIECCWPGVDMTAAAPRMDQVADQMDCRCFICQSPGGPTPCMGFQLTISAALGHMKEFGHRCVGRQDTYRIRRHMPARAQGAEGGGARGADGLAAGLPLQLGRLAGGGRADRHRRHSLLGCGA